MPDKSYPSQVLVVFYSKCCCIGPPDQFLALKLVALPNVCLDNDLVDEGSNWLMSGQWELGLIWLEGWSAHESYL